MATWSDVRAIARELPEIEEHASYGGAPSWRVRRKSVVWERPLGVKDRRDVHDLGIEVPDGPILGVRVADEGVKQSLIHDDPDVFFTIPHLDGFPAVLVRLERISRPVLREIMIEAWLDRAPTRLAQQYLAQQG
jgi:hypothetical protein